MSFGNIRIGALALATWCALAGLSAAGPAQAYNPKELSADKAVPWRATTPKPAAGAVGTTGPRGAMGTTTRGRMGRPK
jgi:phage-related baseplate assembly protein